MLYGSSVVFYRLGLWLPRYIRKEALEHPKYVRKIISGHIKTHNDYGEILLNVISLYLEKLKSLYQIMDFSCSIKMLGLWKVLF